MPAAWPDYELLDFGAGRRLERFGELVVDRPCPAATASRQQPALWASAAWRYEGERAAAGKWVGLRKNGVPLAEQLAAPIRCPLGVGASAAFEMSLSLSPAGQVGLFPEQFAHWQWLAAQTARAENPLRLLNLFAYTGGSTLAVVAAGAEATHVDAAKSAVAAARDNAARSGLAERPVRWIVEDAIAFCRREVKRGRRYHGVILDPPSYGHGPHGEDWQIRRDLLELLELCGELTERRPRLVLLTCHTPGIDQAELAAHLSDGLFGACGQPPRTGEMTLQTAAGKKLPSGIYARWPG